MTPEMLPPTKSLIMGVGLRRFPVETPAWLLIRVGKILFETLARNAPLPATFADKIIEFGAIE